MFETDESSTYVLVTLPACNEAINQAANGDNRLVFKTLEEVNAFGNGAINGAINGADNGAVNHVSVPATEIIKIKIHDRVTEMLEILTTRMKRSELFESLDLSNQSYNRAKYLDPIIAAGWVSMEFPNEKTHPNQTYQITEPGQRILKILKDQ